MPRAMLLRVKRLEAVIGPRAAAPASMPTLNHLLMSGLAAHPDLFREFAAIAEGSRLGMDMGRVGRLAADLAAREGKAWAHA